MKREENPYHKEFGLFSNLKFVLKVMKKYSPILLFLLPVAAILSVGNFPFIIVIIHVYVY